MAGARTAGLGIESSGLLGVKFPARHDQQSMDRSGGGPGDPDEAAHTATVADEAAPELEQSEVDSAAPVWAWDIERIGAPEVDLETIFPIRSARPAE